MIRHASLAAALAAVLVLTGAALAADPAKPPPATERPASSFVHTVIFHLKKDAPAGTAEKIVADCHAMLETIPSVRHLKADAPAPEDQSTPKVSLHDYDVALVVLFDDAAGLKEYLTHETHLKFVGMYEKDFETVQVFDFIDQKK